MEVPLLVLPLTYLVIIFLYISFSQNALQDLQTNGYMQSEVLQHILLERSNLRCSCHQGTHRGESRGVQWHSHIALISVAHLLVASFPCSPTCLGPLHTQGCAQSPRLVGDTWVGLWTKQGAGEKRGSACCHHYPQLTRGGGSGRAAPSPLHQGAARRGLCSVWLSSSGSRWVPAACPIPRFFPPLWGLPLQGAAIQDSRLGWGQWWWLVVPSFQCQLRTPLPSSGQLRTPKGIGQGAGFERGESSH